MLHKKIFLTFVIFPLFVINSLTIDTSFASDDRKPTRQFPHGCRPLGYEFRDFLLILKPDNPQAQTLYFIHNISHSKIQLKRQKPAERTFSPTYKNIIRYQQWAAFATDKKQMIFECGTPSRDEYSFAKDCAQALEICQYNNVKFASHNMGNYWVVKSASRRATIRGAIDNGILLRW